MNESQTGIELSGVTYHYPGSNRGVDNVSLTALPGTVYGLLGANGAGKTTLMRLMTGLLNATNGSIRCLGLDLDENRRKLLASIGTLIEVPSIYHHLTGREHLSVFAHYTSTGRKSVDSVLALVGLGDASNTRVSAYSLGMKQRLAIATALLHDPRILILDEPTNGLDPMGIVAMRELIATLARDRGKTIIVSSHLLGEVEKVAARVGVIHLGRMRFEGAIEDLRASTGANAFRIRVSSGAAAAALLGINGTHDDRSDTIFVDAQSDSEAASAIRRLLDAGIDVFEAGRTAGNLERDFLSLLRDDLNVQ